MHQENFIACVRTEDPSALNADIAIGNDSTGWCNMANIAFQVGGNYASERANEYASEVPLWGELQTEMSQHLKSHGVKITDLTLGSKLTFDSEAGAFTGESAEQANGFLKRKYRAGFEVPELV